MNTNLRQKAENNFEKGFFKLMNNAFFGKTMENGSLVTTERGKNCLVSEPNFSQKMNTPVYFGRSKKTCNVWILVSLCKIKTWWHFVIWIQAASFRRFEDILEGLETIFDISHFKFWNRQTITYRKIKKSNCINERWIRWKNHERICWNTSKKKKLFERQQWWR